jgi:hypothetical protein
MIDAFKWGAKEWSLVRVWLFGTRGILLSARGVQW